MRKLSRRGGLTVTASALVVVIAGVHSLAAQGPGPIGLQTRPAPTLAWESAAPARIVTVQSSEWEQDMLIGAGIGAAFDLLLAWFASDCKRDGCHVIGTYLLGPPLVFALIGGMIGSGVHPHP